MVVTKHPVATGWAGVLIVGVNAADVALYGAEAVLEALQSHPWICNEGQGCAVVIAYPDGPDEALTVYGAQEWVAVLSTMALSTITWDHTLTLQWPEHETPAGDLEWPDSVDDE